MIYPRKHKISVITGLVDRAILLADREIAEMFFIKKNPKTINLERDTENLSDVYDENDVNWFALDKGFKLS
ncbi:hypothetical protein X777_07589 [Ooceraea biroi]|uniref:Uncharacterized protein n=1 Tax=Ooceraea biroi TaxID=2015173 RepID=A0A026X3V8_OOCBI|nr:hypothetical protein X777_07589 [Ooceraea biroi]